MSVSLALPNQRKYLATFSCCRFIKVILHQNVTFCWRNEVSESEPEFAELRSHLIIMELNPSQTIVCRNVHLLDINDIRINGFSGTVLRFYY